MGACSNTSKALLAFLSLLIWAAAAGLIYLAAEVFSTYRHFEEIASATYTLIPASIIVGVAVLLIFIGFIGCVGAFKEHKCLLATFFVFLLAVLTAEISAGSLGYVYRNDVKSTLENGISDGLESYGCENATTLSHEVDYMQTTLKCCGILSYSDWFQTPWYSNHSQYLPESCCTTSNCSLHFNGTDLVPSDDANTEGCYQKLTDVFTSNLVTIAGVSITFAVIQIAGMISSCILMHRSREVPYLNLQSGSGYRA